MAKFVYITPGNITPVHWESLGLRANQLVLNEAHDLDFRQSTSSQQSTTEDVEVTVQLNEREPNKSWRGLTLIFSGGLFKAAATLVFQAEKLPCYQLPVLHCWRFSIPAMVGQEKILSSGHYRLQGDVDPVIYHFAAALLGAVEHPHTHHYFIEKIMTAMCSYIATSCACLEVQEEPVRFGLAGWQEKRVREILYSHLADNIPLETLAAACSLSRSHFARSFKKSTGMTPHQCQVQMRIDRSKHLLEHASNSIAEIGLECGFSDQSHFTRVFFKHVGSTPSAWRRFRRSGLSMGGDG
jgi:AraC family transcriptional regulator